MFNQFIARRTYVGALTQILITVKSPTNNNRAISTY